MMCEALVSIFTHLNKKLRVSPYPIQRALAFVEAISRNVEEQLVMILKGYRLMQLPFLDFEEVYQKFCQVIGTWDEQVKEFTTVARDMTRKRAEKFIPIKVIPAHAQLQERLEYTFTFRKQHEQLHTVFSKAVSSVDSLISNENALDDINLAYDRVKHIDVLALGKGMRFILFWVGPQIFSE